MGPLLVALAIALGPAPAGPTIQTPAQPPTETTPPVPERAPIELVWTAPPGCPPTDDVKRELDALLGDREAGAPWVHVRAEVTANDGGYALALATETASGTTTHQLASPDCRALANAVALVAAVAADPMAVDRTLDRELGVERYKIDPPPDFSAPKPKVTPPLEKRPRLRIARFALRADALLDYNIVPKIGFGPVITLGIFGPHWRTEIGAIYVVPRTLWIDSARTAGADIGMWNLRVRGCGVPVAATVEFPICAALEGGQVTGRPLGAAAPPETETHAWGAFSLGSAVAWSPRPFIALVLGLDLVAPFVRPRFRVPDGRELHRVGRVGLRTNIGIELRVP